VAKKGSGTRDHRSEPDAGGSSDQFRVDRVYVAPRALPSATVPPAKRPTDPPPSTSATGRANTDSELSLRRQLARLQHQLSESQRELANKDDDLAVAVEKRIEIQGAYDVLLEQHRELQQRANGADDIRAQVVGIEERLAAATAEADELRHQLELERTERATIAVQLAEAAAAFECARKEWRDESSLIDKQHAAQLSQLDQQKRALLEAAEHAKTAALDRQREAHATELEALRAAHERELGAIRGELEPKVSEARNLGAEIERLTSELAAKHSEHQNLLVERIELHKWEVAQTAEAHAAELAEQARVHAAELARHGEELAAANQAGQLIERKAALREQLWEQTASTLRESQRKLQQDLAHEKEKAAQADAIKSSLEQRVAAAQQTIDQLDAQVRELRENLDVAAREGRHHAIDRERFAAYLEQGLAMLGVTTPRSDDAGDSLAHDQRPPRDDARRESQPRLGADVRRPSEPQLAAAPRRGSQPNVASEPPVGEPRWPAERFAPDLRPGAIRHPSAHERPTAQFAAILDPPDVELEMDAEPPPLPDPREPTRH
jgi:peptidoglycan DL-endopeptidase RipA